MKNLQTTMMFCLLLAVGWTTDASAQLLSARDAMKRSVKATEVALKSQPQQAGVDDGSTLNGMQRFNAPMRANVTADELRTKAFFDGLDPLTWTDSDGVTQTTLLTEPYTDPWGMIALLKRIYTDEDIPGIQYSASRQLDLPYFAIDYGWNILGNSGDIIITLDDSNCLIASITIEDLTGNELVDWWFEDEDYTLPTGWSTSSELKHITHQGFGGVYMEQTKGTITIPLNLFNNPTSAYRVKIYGVHNATSGYSHYISIDGAIDGYKSANMRTSWSQYTYYLPARIDTPPTYNGYTVLLIKLKDGVNETEDDRAPQFTYNEEELYDYFSTYVSEIQLVPDGVRVGEGDSNAGTMFAYTGMLNKFFFIGKGKMQFMYSTDYDPNYIFMHSDWAPFYSMYEEFSPTSQTDDVGIDDFYVRMMLGEYYPIEHDCESVIFKQHYFSMSGKTGQTENNVNCMVLYIPDNRGNNGTGRDYSTDNQPRVGLYVITLDAEVEPTDSPEWYQVNVTWESNLEDFSNGAEVPQIYRLYEIRDLDCDGDMDTTLVYTGPETYWPFDDPDWPHDDYPVGKEGSCPSDSYPIDYFVIGSPTDATNPETFFAKSNDDEVIIPDMDDFMAILLKGYESDYVVFEEKNYYRNYISASNLSAIAAAGITPNNIGLGVKTLELWRGDKVVAYLEIKMEGNKAYYRIRYDLKYQDIEPGYGVRTNNP